MKRCEDSGQLKGAVRKGARNLKGEFAVGVPWVS